MIKYWYLFAITALTVTSCSNKKEKLLCKRWQVSDVEFLNTQEATVQSDTMQGNLQQRTQIMLRDVMMKNLYEFKEDGTYITGNTEANAEGKWAFSGNNIRFISEKSDGKKEKLVPVEKLEDDTLIVLYKQDQTSFEMKLILTPTP
jgi:hypothetical protein